MLTEMIPGRVMTLIEVVARFYDVSVSELLGRRRYTQIAEIRAVCLYLVRKHTRYSLEEIGSFFDRDHSTVLVRIRRIAERVEREHARTVVDIEQIEAAFRIKEGVAQCLLK